MVTNLPDKNKPITANGQHARFAAYKNFLLTSLPKSYMDGTIAVIYKDSPACMGNEH